MKSTALRKEASSDCIPLAKTPPGEKDSIAGLQGEGSPQHGQDPSSTGPGRESGSDLPEQEIGTEVRGSCSVPSQAWWKVQMQLFVSTPSPLEPWEADGGSCCAMSGALGRQMVKMDF